MQKYIKFQSCYHILYTGRVKRINVFEHSVIQILTAHAQQFRGTRDLAFCLNVPLDSLLVWASSGGSGETARMRRLARTFAARIGDKYQIRLTRPSYYNRWCHLTEASMNPLVMKFLDDDSSNVVSITVVSVRPGKVAITGKGSKTKDEQEEPQAKHIAFQCHQEEEKTDKWHVRPAETQISLNIRPVWSESSQCAQWVAAILLVLSRCGSHYKRYAKSSFVPNEMFTTLNWLHKHEKHLNYIKWRYTFLGSYRIIHKKH